MESTSTEEEETNSHDDKQTVVNSVSKDNLSTHSVSIDAGADSESEIPTSEFNNNFNNDEIDEYDMLIEDFIDQLDADNNNRTTPLYSGSPISVHDACIRLIRLAHLLNLDKNKTSVLLKELRNFFPSDCLLPKTIFRLFQITNIDHRPQVCPKNILSFLICALYFNRYLSAVWNVVKF